MWYIIIWGAFILYNFFLNKEGGNNWYLEGIVAAFNFIISLIIALVASLIIALIN